MKALNRKEALVNAKANSTLDSFKPLTREEAFTKKALELGGGASSWNDLTDKPFGEEVVRLVDNVIVTTVGDVSSTAFWNETEGDPIDIIIEGGATYMVTLDGVSYKCVAIPISSSGDGSIKYFIGSLYFFSDGQSSRYDDEGKPFSYSDGWFSTSTAGSHTVSIDKVVTQPVNADYLPSADVVIEVDDIDMSDVTLDSFTLRTWNVDTILDNVAKMRNSEVVLCNMFSSYEGVRYTTLRATEVVVNTNIDGTFKRMTITFIWGTYIVSISINSTGNLYGLSIDSATVTEVV